MNQMLESNSRAQIVVQSQEKIVQKKKIHQASPS